MTSTFKFNGWPLLFVLALLVGMQMLWPSKVWVTIIIALGVTLAASWFWARQMQQHITLTREKRYNWTRVGDRLEERFTLRSSKSNLLPVLWAEIDDQSTVPGYNPNRVTGIEGNGGSSQWTVSGICRQRGVFNLGPTTLRMGDPLGLLAVTQYYPATVPLLVLPPILDLPGIQVAPGGQLSEGHPRPYTSQPTILATSVRPYIPGDSLHLIHWPTTARRNELYVRTFDGSPTGNWWIVLDLAKDVHTGEGDDSTLEQSITLAASLLETGLQAGHAVGLIAHSDKPIWLTPARGDTQRWMILRKLATTETGSYPLVQLLQRSGDSLGHSASVVIITPAPDPAWLESLLLLKKRDLIPTVMLLTGNSQTAEKNAFYELLTQHGITAYLLEPDILKPSIDPAEAEGRWEWHTSALGRAVAVHRPQGEWELMQ
jgi:uncharacterized protein (DUF58 family)